MPLPFAAPWLRPDNLDPTDVGSGNNSTNPLSDGGNAYEKAQPVPLLPFANPAIIDSFNRSALSDGGGITLVNAEEPPGGAENPLENSRSSITAAGDAAAAPVTLNDGTVLQSPYDDNRPVVMPPGMSLDDTISFGKAISSLPQIAKDAAMYFAFRRFGPLDFQREPGSISFDRTYRDFGNFNYGAVAAAAGYPIKDTLYAAGKYNQSGAGDKSGVFGNSVRNNFFIHYGYGAYQAGLLGNRKNGNGVAKSPSD